MSVDLTVARQFGMNLAKARIEAGLSQEGLGLCAGLHRTEVGLLERGERTPRIDTLAKLAGALGLPLGCALLKGVRWTPGSTATGKFTTVAPGDQVSTSVGRVGREAGGR